MRASPVLFFALTLLCGRPAAAQTFSPGPLTKDHHDLEGIANCGKCHSAEKKVDAKKCTACHTPITHAIATRVGHHGHLPAEDRDHCERCHAEHRGLSHSLVPWPGGGPKQYPHERSGFPLRGAHVRIDCLGCHDKKLIRDESVLGYLAKYPGSQSWLGLGRKCLACHVDAHDRSLGSDCEKCHSEVHWKPAPGFNHDTSRYPLLSLHRPLQCDQCHPPGDTLARDARYRERRFSPLRFAQCSECHDDPHQGQLGPLCSECHTESGWKIRKAPSKLLEDHDRTRFPLRGQHRAVDCKLCHPLVRGKQQLRGLKFGECADCHGDGHLGQIRRVVPPSATSSATSRPPACETCHSNFGFSTVSFGPDQHEKTRFPLAGAHGGVPCLGCHKPTAALRKQVADLRRKGGRPHGVRRGLVSDARFSWEPKTLGRCTTCHKDVHAGQFAERVAKQDCAACHVAETFHTLKFDHDKDSRFALRGAHRTTDCALCHVADRKTGTVRYKPLSQACSSCHADEHYGQFADRKLDCNGCHDVAAWRPAPGFRHDAKGVRFALDGKHQAVACDQCHHEVRLGGKAKARHYRPLVVLCEGCHEDQHKGRYDSFVPVALRDTARRQLLPNQPVPRAVPCSFCHNTEAWQRVAFDHDRTGFPLTGGHVRASCTGCHVGTLGRKVSARCAACHADVHDGALGTRCERCHNTARWIESRDLDAHRFTSFRLVGGHAAVKCEECHRNVRDRTFRRLPTQCDYCHKADVARTAGKALDHQGLGLTATCERCHTPLRWQGAFYPDHDRCFPITRGAHAGVGCLRCHKSLGGGRVTAACNTNTATCSLGGCHPCTVVDAAHMRANVQGYQCQERKCYECHPAGRR